MKCIGKQNGYLYASAVSLLGKTSFWLFSQGIQYLNMLQNRLSENEPAQLAYLSDHICDKWKWILWIQGQSLIIKMATAQSLTSLDVLFTLHKQAFLGWLGPSVVCRGQGPLVVPTMSSLDIYNVISSPIKILLWKRKASHIKIVGLEAHETKGWLRVPDVSCYKWSFTVGSTPWNHWIISYLGTFGNVSFFQFNSIWLHQLKIQSGSVTKSGKDCIE